MGASSPALEGGQACGRVLAPKSLGLVDGGFVRHLSRRAERHDRGDGSNWQPWRVREFREFLRSAPANSGRASVRRRAKNIPREMAMLEARGLIETRWNGNKGRQVRLTAASLEAFKRVVQHDGGILVGLPNAAA